MTRTEKWASTGVAVLVLASTIPITVVGGAATLVVVIAVMLGGWKLIPGFWRILGGGALAGAFAGLLILGPGFRLAMRMVAILEPTRSVEFSVGGTMLIIVFVGGILGATFGIAGIFARRGLDLSSIATSMLMAVAVLGGLLIDAELRSEIMELGAGPWMNIPIFAFVGFVYGRVTQGIYDRLPSKTIQKAPRLEVMA